MAAELATERSERPVVFKFCVHGFSVFYMRVLRVCGGSVSADDDFKAFRRVFGMEDEDVKSGLFR